MKEEHQRLTRGIISGLIAIAVFVLIGLSRPPEGRADEADARRLLKAMTDFMVSQQVLSFDYDTILEVVSTDGQKLGLASSGTVTLERPDKIHATHHGGFADVELFYNGKELTFLGRNLNLYSQFTLPGTIDHLIDELKDTHNRPLPGADLLLSNAYDELMLDVVDVKDLGSGVIGGVACDHLAFRKKEVDWQIWIARGASPFPLRFVITSTRIDGEPQYVLQTRNWKVGDKVAASEFVFDNQSGATEIALQDLEGVDHLPSHFTLEGAK